MSNALDLNALRGRSRYPGKVEPKLHFNYWGNSCVALDAGEYLDSTYTGAVPTPFTVFTWIKFDTPSAPGEIISKNSYYASSTNDFPFHIHLQTDRTLFCDIDSGMDWAHDLRVTSPALSINEWHFVSARWDGTNLHLDTDATKTSGAKALSVSAGSRQWRLGLPSYHDGGGVGGLRYVGKLYGFGLYNALKTDAQIAAIRAGYLDKASALILWNFIEGTGTTLADASGNGRNCAFGGSAAWAVDSPWG
jgi:hypothetical protein